MKSGHEGLDGFEEIAQEFPFGTFRLEKQDYLFRCSVAPGGNFSLGRPKKVADSVYFTTRFSGNFFAKKLESTLKRGKLTA